MDVSLQKRPEPWLQPDLMQFQPDSRCVGEMQRLKRPFPSQVQAPGPQMKIFRGCGRIGQIEQGLAAARRTEEPEQGQAGRKRERGHDICGPFGGAEKFASKHQKACPRLT